MTNREKAIVMAYTGVCMLTGDKFQIFHKYVEDIMGRHVYTHEMGIKAVDDKIKEKARPDFIALCAESEDVSASSDCVIDNIIVEIETYLTHFCFDDWGNENFEWKEVKAIINKHKGDRKR